jgi:uncharacterized surface protein with fasciclin (FAS1) repeats
MNRKWWSLVVALVFLLNAIQPGKAEPMAQLRIAYFVPDSPAVDLYIDGKVSVPGITAGEATEYLSLAPGAHQLALVPTGKDLSAALSKPADLKVESDHAYTVSVVGQAADNSVQPLLIDETTKFTAAERMASPQIMVNNIKGAPPIDVILGGKTVIHNLAYGQYATATFEVSNYDGISIVAANDPKIVLLPAEALGPIFIEPTVAYVVGLMGTFPGEFGKDYTLALAAERTPLNVPDFLAAFHGRKLSWPKGAPLPFIPQEFNFDTLLAALDKAGLKEMLAKDGPYILFAPTDEAFAALPAGTLDKWMADPQTLKNVLLFHVVKGKLTGADLNGTKMLTTLQGLPLTLTRVADPQPIFMINGSEAGCGCNYQTANDSRVFVIDHVLMPSTMQAMASTTK